MADHREIKTAADLPDLWLPKYIARRDHLIKQRAMTEAEATAMAFNEIRDGYWMTIGRNRRIAQRDQQEALFRDRLRGT